MTSNGPGNGAIAKAIVNKYYKNTKGAKKFTTEDLIEFAYTHTLAQFNSHLEESCKLASKNQPSGTRAALRVGRQLALSWFKAKRRDFKFADLPCSGWHERVASIDSPAFEDICRTELPQIEEAVAIVTEHVIARALTMLHRNAQADGKQGVLLFHTLSDQVRDALHEIRDMTKVCTRRQEDEAGGKEPVKRQEAQPKLLDKLEAHVQVCLHHDPELLRLLSKVALERQAPAAGTLDPEPLFQVYPRDGGKPTTIFTRREIIVCPGDDSRTNTRPPITFQPPPQHYPADSFGGEKPSPPNGERYAYNIRLGVPPFPKFVASKQTFQWTSTEHTVVGHSCYGTVVFVLTKTVPGAGLSQETPPPEDRDPNPPEYEKPGPASRKRLRRPTTETSKQASSPAKEAGSPASKKSQ